MAEVFLVPSESNKEKFDSTVAIAADYLKNKRIIAMPSDTLYGLFSSFEKDLINRIHKIKKRDKSHPFLVVIPESYSLEEIADRDFLASVTKEGTDRFWPGKNTLILKKKPELEYPQGNTIAVRKPLRSDNPFFYEVIQRFNGPVIAPSLNIHGEKPLDNLKEILDVFNDLLDAVFYNEKFTPEGPSKIIDMTVKPFRQLR